VSILLIESDTVCSLKRNFSGFWGARTIAECYLINMLKNLFVIFFFKIVFYSSFYVYAKIENFVVIEMRE